MNYLEFKRQLMVDPYDQSPAFREALKGDPDCAAAAAQSDNFEGLLRSAISSVAVPEDLVELAISQRHPKPSVQRTIGWLPAMAAGLMMGVGLTTAAFIFNNSDTELQTVEQHLASHWTKDGEITLQMAALNPMEAGGIQRVLSTLSLDAADSLMGDIIYARNCGTPHGNGVHMVMRTETGLVTAIYMPDTEITDSQSLQVLTNKGLLIPMQQGAVALVAANQESIDTGMNAIKSGLQEKQRIEV